MIKRIEEPPGAADLEWLIDVVWALSLEEARAGRSRHRDRDGDRVAVIPGIERPRFLAPLTSRAAATASLVSNNRMRLPRMRIARRMLGIVFGLGVGPTIFRDELALPWDGTDSLAHHLHDVVRDAVGVDDVALSASLAGPDPARKPVIQFLSRDGRVLAYAKVGWNAATRSLVRNEVSALRRAAAGQGVLVRAPAVLHAGRWNDCEVLVTEPLARGARAHRPVDRPPPARATLEIAELAPVVTCALAHSAFWKQLTERADRTLDGADQRTRATVHGSLRSLGERIGSIELRFGAWHGDWSPWNLSWLRGNLFALDWEYFGESVPLGFDVVGYPFQVTRSGGHRSVAEAVANMRAAGVPRLGELGLDPTAGSAVADLYIVELFVRCRELWCGSGIRPKIHDPLLDELRRLEAGGDDSRPSRRKPSS